MYDDVNTEAQSTIYIIFHCSVHCAAYHHVVGTMCTNPIERYTRWTSSQGGSFTNSTPTHAAVVDCAIIHDTDTCLCVVRIVCGVQVLLSD